ncbi:4-hydroxybenzoate 3-monooxygenase [Rhodococcus triatomae]|uniref:p-hydroxybenzoate 3-monooxygenase n=1 Tax=Rhodococcus triatomae TaxID=300028 RepID=A0A1G7ZLG1_9NOCA|nr:4-hydroxybenzoate 3-monooxygenase [Rhodococcus triatomae]QNG18010.1 4-hydroxybenzoate 3-monooxygenase [Rhodococcus triatomae]QNG22321.1 4-hydroxybenzoate 3-monooxygenase [Rhodococcus triatomae]SDH09528.1 p-hydroxybenzoate 3-monooxygenase [Rhodococcus triatomae]
MRPHVVVIGAGPAGLVLARLLELQGITSVVLEARDREYIENRTRAGILEQPTVDLLRDIGSAERLDREGMTHDGFYLRFDRATHHLDFHALTGGHATVYGQQELVKDLVAQRLAGGGPLVFGARVTDVDLSADHARVVYEKDGVQTEVDADFVAGCDGFHGVSRHAIPAALRREHTRAYPFSWLGILAHSTPATPEGMYCAHERGLSVHSMRGPRITRQYLQVPADTALTEWPDERIWDELSTRSAADDAPALDRGEIFDRSLAPLRSFVCETMQYRRLFLLGDAAHIVPPTGAKGLNLAVSDASTLAYALGAHHATGSRTEIEAYSATCLPRIWQAQLFSATLTATLHADPTDPIETGLRFARLRRWTESEAERRALGEVYLGLPFPTPWKYPEASGVA